MTDYQADIDALRSELGFDFVALSIVPAGAHPVLTWQYASGNLNNRYRRIVLASGLGIAGIVFKTGKSLLYTDVNTAIARQEMVQYPIIIGEGLSSLCSVPLWCGDDLAAIILAGYRYVGGANAQKLEQMVDYLSNGFAGFTVDQLTKPLEPNDISEPTPDSRQPVYDLMTFKILEAQEAERKRIARELHDGVVQELLGTQILLRQTRYIDNPAQKDQLIATATERINHLLDEVRRIAVEQRPSTLDNLGLEATLEDYAKRQAATFGLDIALDSSIGGARFSPSVETAVYRVCQEAVINACKYSAAEAILISLRANPDDLYLQVGDNGVGFEPAQSVSSDELGRSGLGINGMYERAELVEGKLTITSLPGQGTTVELTVPCRAQGEQTTQGTEENPDDTPANS